MSTPFDSQLNEALRDALVAYYLDEVVRESPQLQALGVKDTLKDANDLYRFLLLDVQVSQDIQTSRVASAISSLQQHLNSIVIGMEPGYETRAMESHLINQWRDQQAQYPMWAATQQLAWYPEIYIDPTLRLKKTRYFRQLENDINQNKISIDTVQEAVKSYLTNFERVANLSVINGYINSDNFATGVYYFIGKARGETAYYWRSVDMSQRSSKGQADGPKLDNPQPGAWTDWEEAALPVSQTALEHTLRPVYFNNRLFVTWLEYMPGDNAAFSVDEKEKTPSTVDSRSLVRLMMVYKKYDDSWSAPNDVLSWHTDEDPNHLRTITVQDSATSLFIALYAGYKNGAAADGSADTYALLKTARMDRNFNVLPLFPVNGKVPDSSPHSAKKTHVLKVGRLFALTNQGRLQFRMPPLHVSVKSVHTASPYSATNDWNVNDLQRNIAQTSNVDIKYDRTTAHLEFHSKIISAPRETNRTITLNLTALGVTTTFACVINENDEGPFIKLLPGSTITSNSKNIKPNTEGYRFTFTVDNSEYDVLRDNKSTRRFTLKSPVNARYSIEGKYIDINAINSLSNTHQPVFASIYTHQNGNESLTSWGFVYLDRVKPVRFQHHISRPKTINGKSTVWPQAYSSNHVSLLASAWSDNLTPPDTLVLKVSINEDTLRPDWSVQWPSSGKDGSFIPFIHGIAVQSGSKIIGYANKGVLVELELLPPTSKNLVAPKINTRHSEALGMAEFIDFQGSDISKSDDSTQDRSPLRMNTLFARELTEKVDVALEHLLSWETQSLPEPPMNGHANANSDVMDFHGANGLYFWELFLHLPFLIGYRLNLEHDFTEAERWYNFIFDPSRKADHKNGRPAFWNVRPLVENKVRPGYATSAATDPDGIASSYPIRYQKAVYRHYLQNLIDRGDAAYRELTPDSLGEAKLWYVRVLELLGNRPEVKLIDHWTPTTLKRLSSEANVKLRHFEMQLAGQDQLRLQSQSLNKGISTYNFEQPPLRLRTFSEDPTLSELDSPHLRLPLNFKLVELWDTLESRMKNLRSHRTLDGKPLSLPLFAAPLNPRDTLAGFGRHAIGSKGNRSRVQETPPYRFTVMHNRASAAVETLMQFGNTLLSLIERKEQAQLLELQHQHVWDFAQFAIDLQQQTLKADQQNREALLASRQIVEARLSFYRERSDEIVSRGEIAAGAAHLAGRQAETVSAVAGVVGCALKTVPNHYGVIAGLANGVISGGWRLEGPAEMASAAAAGVAATCHGIGEALDRVEQYRRRHQEWMLARDQARLEIEQINAQLECLDEQRQITELQLRQAQTSLEQAKITYAFLGKRFTRSQLYQWLNGQFASFYYQVYDAALSLCLAAEACWQYELADFSTRFVQTSAWNDAYRGLTAGESLKLNLLKMESAYLARNVRALEITKTVSLRQLAANDPQSQLNKDWDTMHIRLQAHGSVDFELTQAMFDNDYPGQYCRRIKRVSVSLPVTLGPYQDIRATLTQTYNKVEMASDNGANVRENLRASQQIALSSGIDDDGMFTLNFDDERYLPFEGTGAVSRWSLQFPNHTDQQAALASMTDIIVHVQYTARVGTGA